MYLSYVRSMDNLYVLLYDCIFNWNTRTSRCDNQSEITAENRNHVHLMQIFRYTLTFLFACLLFTAHWYTHSVTCCPASVPAFWSSGNTNGFRITLSVLVCAPSLVCVLSISLVFHVFLLFWWTCFITHHLKRVLCWFFLGSLLCNYCSFIAFHSLFLFFFLEPKPSHKC